MGNIAWILWSIIGIVLIVAETFTLGFFLLWFGVGALAAALAASLGAGIYLQFLIFAGISIVLTALSRTIFYNSLTRNDEAKELKSAVDALPGLTGTIVNSGVGNLQESTIKVLGTTWRAFPIEGEEPLQEGEKVEIVSVRGASVVVRRANALPEWRGNND